MSSNWTKILLTIPDKYYLKETEKAYCFKLWEKKFIAMPKKFVTRFFDDLSYKAVELPHWYVAEHGLRSFVDEDIRDTLFPLKGRKKKVVENDTPDMFSTVPATPEDFGGEDFPNYPISKNEDWF